MVSYVRNNKTIKAVKWIFNNCTREMIKPIEDYALSADIDEYTLRDMIKPIVINYNKLLELGVLDRVNSNNINNYFIKLDDAEIKKIYTNRFSNDNMNNGLSDLEISSICVDIAHKYLG